MSADKDTANVLSRLSDSLAAAVERAGASIVTVSARARIPASGIAWPGDGLVITCDHVIERDDEITVGLPSGEEANATLVGRDPGSDLAVLRVAGHSLAPAELVPAGEARVGHIVLAVGRPAAGDPMASLGVISAIGGPWRTMRGSHVDGYIRTDTTFFPGFSGGPLIDAMGRVVGVNSSRLGRGAGMTIPAAATAKVVDALVKQGRILHGWLGVASQPARLPASLAAKLDGQESGLLLVMVEAGSPAEQAGLMMGDILVAMAGSPVADTDDLQAQLGPESVGQQRELKVLRGGNPIPLTITVGERK
jgi:S1-C subfamily serine protease